MLELSDEKSKVISCVKTLTNFLIIVSKSPKFSSLRVFYGEEKSTRINYYFLFRKTILVWLWKKTRCVWVLRDLFPLKTSTIRIEVDKTTTDADQNLN